MKNMINALILVFMAAISADSSSAENQEWRWYYASFMSPTNSAPFTRHGTARLFFKNGAVQFRMRESGKSENEIIENGIIKADRVDLRLKSFFQHSDTEALRGNRRLTVVRNGCEIEEIFLVSDSPNGTILVFSRFPKCAQ